MRITCVAFLQSETLSRGLANFESAFAQVKLRIRE